jgi:RNA polymerase sigma-B factor
LNAPAAGTDGVEVVDLIGSVDEDLERVEDRLTMLRLIRHLPVREQRMLAMRFYGNKSQTEIAEALGISQMHVSRLLATTLAKLREAMLGDGLQDWPQDTHRSPHAATVLTEPQSGDLVVALRGEIDEDNAGAARMALHEAISATSHGGLTIDLSGVPLLAAAGVAVLHDVARIAATTGRTFKIAHPQPYVAKVLAATGLGNALHPPKTSSH